MQRHQIPPIYGHPLTDESEITPVSLFLNVLWLICGGVAAALGWFLAALILAVTIIGLPWARAAFDIGFYTLWPFGVRAAPAGVIAPEEEIFGGALSTVGNIIWLVLAGWWLAAGHLFAALLFAITIIGLPFAWAHIKLAGFALWPVGRRLVSSL